METQEKSHFNEEPQTNDPQTGNGFLVSEQTEGVTVDKGVMDKQESGLGEENNGDDYLGEANKKGE